MLAACPRTTVTGSWERRRRTPGGLVTREQLSWLGHDRHYVRSQLARRRWQQVSATVLATTTGTLTREQLAWAGTLHAGARAAVGGLTAARDARAAGLATARRRPSLVRRVGQHRSRSPGSGSSRPDATSPDYRSPSRGAAHLSSSSRPCCCSPPTPRSERTAAGVLAAGVQQGLTTPRGRWSWVASDAAAAPSPVFRGVAGRHGGRRPVGRRDRRRPALPQARAAAAGRQVRRRDRRGVGATPTASGTCPTAGSSCWRWTAAFHMEPSLGGTTWPANASSSSPARW